MKKHLLTFIGSILTLSAIPLVIQGYTLAAALFCIVAFFMIYKEIASLSSITDFAAGFFAILMLGIVLDSSMGKFPFLTLSMFFTGTVVCTRMVFMKTFNYNRFLWFEPLCTLTAITLYIYGNISYSSGWIGWTLPLPFLCLSLWFLMGNLLEFKLSKKLVQKGYRVEIGKVAPEFALPDQNGNTIKLSDFKNQRDLLLVFVRGDWCPGCHIMLRTYERNREKFQMKNVIVFAIGPDPVGINHDMVKRLGIDYKVLSDTNQQTAKAFGVQIPDKIPGIKYEEGIPMPAAFLIDRNGIVRYTSRPDRVGEFLDPATIFPILESLN